MKMKWFLPFAKNVIFAMTVLELFGQFFSFSDWLHKIVLEYLYLVIAALVFYAGSAYVIYDIELFTRKADRKKRLKGAARRSKPRRR